MGTPRRPVALLLLFLPLFPALRVHAGAGQRPDSEPVARTTAAPEVRLEARALEPGEIALVSVTTQDDLQGLAGTACGRTLRFWRSDAGVWKALVGIDLGTPAGPCPLRIAAKGPGQPLSWSYDVPIGEKAFATRRLTVAPRFVNPPASARGRIAREARRLSRIFAGASGERLWTAPFGPPVPGAPVSGFGIRSILNGQPRQPHSGADMRAAAGTPIVAPAGGKVVLAATLYYTGNTVVMDHGLGLFSLFAHMSRMDVKSGESVAAGDPLGRVGATGRVTGPHLHWSVRLNGARVDPIALLDVFSNPDGPGSSPEIRRFDLEPRPSGRARRVAEPSPHALH